MKEEDKLLLAKKLATDIAKEIDPSCVMLSLDVIRSESMIFLGKGGELQVLLTSTRVTISTFFVLDQNGTMTRSRVVDFTRKWSVLGTPIEMVESRSIRRGENKEEI